jgi:hypothetical protein
MVLIRRVFFTRTGIHPRVEPEDMLRSKTLYMRDGSGSVRIGQCAERSSDAPDHDDFESDRSKIMNVIDSNFSERDAGGKPLHTLFVIPLYSVFERSGIRFA